MYYGDSFADLATMRLEGKIKNIYAQAYREIEEKLNTFLAKSVIKEQEYEAKVQAGKLSQEWFDRWKSGQVFIGKRWRDLRQNIAHEIYNSRKSATDMINGERKAVFQDNVNYTQYSIDKDHSFSISFTLYDNATVTRLIKEDPDLVPDVKYPDPQIDYAWSKKQITSAITQGILQGESIPELAKRVGKKLQSSNEKSMVRCARTAMTGAQNSGRIQAMHNAQGMGIDVEKLWIATLDGKTRDSHRDLDGQLAKVNEPFHSLLGDIMFPGDPNANPANLWNCRCSLGWNYPKYSNQYDTRAARDVDWEDGGQTEQIPYMTYKEWAKWKKTGQLPQRGLANISSQNNQAENEEQQIAENIRNVVQGKDMTGEWQRRQDEFSFEIEDVINAQGFDGLPRVVSQEEFEKAVGESGFIAQRAYSAPDKETLDAYRDQLYNGKWYVDCSVGGARHGQGMYCVADYSGVITPQMQSEMSSYATMYGTRPAYIETFTVTKDFKYVEEKEIRIKMAQYNSSLARKSFRNSLDELINNPEIVSKNIAAYKKYYGVTMSESEMKTYMEGMQWIKQKKSYDLPDSDVEKAAKKIAKKYKLKDHSLVESQFMTSNAYKESMKNSIYDVGSYASLAGYDGIQVSGRDEEDAPYVVILNRTKVIFKRDDK